MEWETVIGLEIHAQLSTKSKIFSAASTAYGAEPNTQACAVDLGFPGVLPVLNQDAVKKAIKFGLAIGAEMAPRSVFARKNYFYPDLPKGYQISQFELPIVGKGTLEITLESGETRSIGVTRAHLEEDAGKSLHEDFAGMTGVDLNRAGTPLLESVSEPDMRNPEEAVAYMKKIHALVQYIGICDGNMQEGSFRCDANVSVRPKGEEELGTRTEIKNLNSFRFIEKAINYEVERQIDLIEDGGKIIQQTRLYDPDKHETRPMRSKEEANDYRYFPDPDLLPVELDPELLEAIRKTMPELPEARKTRFISDYNLSKDDAEVLTSSRDLADYFETVAEKSGDVKLSANWVMSTFVGALNKNHVETAQSPVSAESFAGLLARIADNSVSGKVAKDIFETMWNGEGEADEIIEAKGLKQISDSSALEKMADEVIAANPSQVAEFKGGKDKLLGYFVGQVMKASKGQANPGEISKIIKQKLSG